jgi:hypothetical protein
MASLLIPILIIEKLDRKRRILAGDDACSGAKCLVAWEKLAPLDSHADWV